MALRVKCPNGCEFRTPSKNAGKVVHCPKCQAAVRLGKVNKRPKAVDAELQAFVAQVSQRTADADLANIDTGEPVAADEAKLAFAEREAGEVQIDSRSTRDQISGRANRSRRDRILLSKIAAVFIIVVGLINLVPGIYHWYLWAQEPLASELPRWIYMLIFLAVIHLLYAVFVLQVPDWSALRAVSVVMLLVAAVCGFISVGIVLGGASSPTVRFLGIHYSMLNSAIIWCVAMLLLAIVTSYMTAKESYNWQRIDQILQSVSNSESAGTVA